MIRKLSILCLAVLLAGCRLGVQPQQPPMTDEMRNRGVDDLGPKKVTPKPRADAALDGQPWPAEAEVIAPQSNLAKAATSTPGLTLLKRQMVTLTANLPVNTNGYRLEKALNETGTWVAITSFTTNKFTYQDLNLKNPIWIYRAVPIPGPVVPPPPPPKLASKQLWWDASPTAGVTNYLLRWGTNSLRTPALTAVASNLVSGSSYSFTVTAFGINGESAATPPLVYKVP